MLTDQLTLTGLVLSCIVSLILFVFIAVKKNKKQIQKAFLIVIVEIFVWCLLLIAQATLSTSLKINPLTFDNFVYIFSSTVPVMMLIIGLIFANTKIKITYKHLMLFIIPVISLLILWTNDYHHLFYKSYSNNISETIFGGYFYIHSIYSYICLLIAMFYLVFYSIKNSGFFSKQSIIVVVGTIIPVMVNVLGTFKIISISIYMTPITFVFAIAFYAIAILKFQFLNISPIALQKINDSMSDGYIVLNEDMKIIDNNKTLINMLQLEIDNLRNKDIEYFGTIVSKLGEVNIPNLIDTINGTRENKKMITIEKYFDKIDKYFSVEISVILNKNSYIGTLIVFKDITQHMKDLEKIKENQEVILSQEKYTTLGQLARRNCT
jgi:hypothetical protein